MFRFVVLGALVSSASLLACEGKSTSPKEAKEAPPVENDGAQTPSSDRDAKPTAEAERDPQARLAGQWKEKDKGNIMAFTAEGFTFTSESGKSIGGSYSVVKTLSDGLVIATKIEQAGLEGTPLEVKFVGDDEIQVTEQKPGGSVRNFARMRRETL